MNKQELINTIQERYETPLKEKEEQVTVSEMVSIVLDTYADLRLPELEERLEMYEGSQFKTFGKIDEMEKMQNL